MSKPEIKDKIILEEYFSFLYDLSTKKNYLHASQLTDEEKKYCDQLISGCKGKPQLNESYLPLMKNILRSHYSSVNG